jgi:hypothetical protein
MRILMFAPAFAPLNNPEAIVNSKLALAFLKEGYQIDVVSNKISTDYNYNADLDPIWEPLKNLTVFISPGKKRGIYKYLSQLFCSLATCHPIAGCRWGYFAFQTAFEMSRRKEYDIIISRAMPEYAHLPALMLSKRTGIPWITNWNDPHSVKTPHPWEQVNDLSFFESRFLKAVVKHSSWHTFPSEKLRVYMSKYMGGNILKKSSVIEHIALPYKIQNKVDGKFFNICYAGALYKGREPSFFLNAINAIGNELPEIRNELRIFFIGRFDEGLSESIWQNNLEGITKLIEPKTYSSTLEYTSRMDVLLLIETNYKQGIFLPSKFVDYFQVSRPILAIGARDSEVESILKNYGGGYYVPHNELALLKITLFKLYRMWKTNCLDSIVTDSKLESKFSHRTIIANYNKLFSLVK